MTIQIAREETRCPHYMVYSFRLAVKIAHTTAFVTAYVEHWLETEITRWVHHEGSTWRPVALWADFH